MDVSLGAFGAKPGCDISNALQAGVLAVGRAGGGRVKIPPGGWKFDNAKTVFVQHNDVVLEGTGDKTHIEVVNWQAFVPKPLRPDGHSDATNHASLVVGSPTRDVNGFSLRNVTFVSQWDKSTHAPKGPQGDSKGLILLGWPDQKTKVRNTLVRDVRSERCGSYLVSVTGRHEGLTINRCSVSNQFMSAFACVGAHFGAKPPKLLACSASGVTGFGVQWTGPAHIEGFQSADCHSGGILLINNDDAPGAAKSLVQSCRIVRAGNMASAGYAGSGLYVGGEFYGGRRVRVLDCTITDSYGSGVAFGGGNLKDIEIGQCLIENFGLGCGTDNSDFPYGKQSGIQPTAGISLAGYKIALRDNTIVGHHTGFRAGQTVCRFGIWLGATESDGFTFRNTMLAVKDCALGNKVTGVFAEARLYLPQNASDR